MRQVAVQTPERSTVSPEGRIVIPASVRRQAGIAPGDVLSFSVDENGGIRMRTRAQALAQLRAIFDDVEGSVVDELIAGRRAEVAREAEKDRLHEEELTRIRKARAK